VPGLLAAVWCFTTWRWPLGSAIFLIEAAPFIPSRCRCCRGFKIQDRCLVEKISYRGRNPERRRIVVFNSPFHFDPALRVITKGQGHAALLLR